MSICGRKCLHKRNFKGMCMGLNLFELLLIWMFSRNRHIGHIDIIEFDFIYKYI